MIVKKVFNPIRVASYVKTEMIFALAVACTVWLLHGFDVSVALVPFSVAAILGSALAIFIAFRNNSAYARWWEARTLWGGIVNSSRVLARLIITFTDSHAHQPAYNADRGEKFKREMVYACIAWVHALRIHLRREISWEELRILLGTKEFEAVKQSQNKPNFLHLLIGRKIYAAMADGTLGGFDSFQMEGQLLALANYQGGCERIKNTPLLRQYHFFTRVFLYVFMFFLPFALVGDFARLNADFLLVPVSFTVSFVFAILGKVGEMNEDPFENRITDVPLNALCINIERDLREMLGESELPPRPEAIRGFIH